MTSLNVQDDPRSGGGGGKVPPGGPFPGRRDPDPFPSDPRGPRVTGLRTPDEAREQWVDPLTPSERARVERSAEVDWWSKSSRPANWGWPDGGVAA